MSSEIWSFHSGVAADHTLLWYDIILIGIWTMMFLCKYLSVLEFFTNISALLNREDTTLPQKVGIQLPTDAASYPRRLKSSAIS